MVKKLFLFVIALSFPLFSGCATTGKTREERREERKDAIAWGVITGIWHAITFSSPDKKEDKENPDEK